jgi:hypothetical protein
MRKTKNQIILEGEDEIILMFIQDHRTKKIYHYKKEK